MNGHYAPRYRLSLVRETADDEPQPKLSSPAAARILAQRILADEPAEAMLAIYTDQRNRIVGTTIPYRGTINRAAAEPRGIMVPGLLMNAAGFILAHNHPSGDPTPSADDIAFTKRLAQAGEIVGVLLVDHLIVAGPHQWTSLRELGAW